MAYDVQHTARLADIQNLATKVKETFTTKTETSAIDERVTALEDVGSQANVIEHIQYNGTELTITDKTVNVVVPTKVSGFSNDANYQNATQVATTVNEAIAASGHAHFEKVSAVPDVDSAEVNVMYLVFNGTTGHYDIYAKVESDGSYTMEQLDDTTVDLSNYVTKVEGKELSTNDFTNDYKDKLDGITADADKVEKSSVNGNIKINDTETVVYTHPTQTAFTSGLYKITTNNTGHVTAATAVVKKDITDLGVPAQDTTYDEMTGASEATDGKAGLVPTPTAGNQLKYLRADGTWSTPTNTTYSVATQSTNGLMSAADKTKLDGIVLSTDAETAEMLTEVFG